MSTIVALVVGGALVMTALQYTGRKSVFTTTVEQHSASAHKSVCSFAMRFQRGSRDVIPIRTA